MSNPKKLRIGAKNLATISRMWVWFKMDIRTENMTTNPPINNIV